MDYEIPVIFMGLPLVDKGRISFYSAMLVLCTLAKTSVEVTCVRIGIDTILGCLHFPFRNHDQATRQNLDRAIFHPNTSPKRSAC